jgi:hypothetical protein
LGPNAATRRRWQTVDSILPRFGIAPAPKLPQQVTWADFIRSHIAVVATSDFFTIEVLTLHGLVTYYCSFCTWIRGMSPVFTFKSIMIAAVTLITKWGKRWNGFASWQARWRWRHLPRPRSQPWFRTARYGREPSTPPFLPGCHRIRQGHSYGRYIFVGDIGEQWIVAPEQGGIALRDVIFAYKLDKHGKTAAETEKRITFPNNACARTQPSWPDVDQIRTE